MRRLGKYHLVAELARGGMGIVWLAESRGPRGFAKRCVVKELLPELARDAHRCAMFLDEASLAARLSHRNIVQTHEVGEDDGRWFMALELLEGVTLRRLGDLAGGRLRPELAVRIASEVLRGLHHAHELRDEGEKPLGIVHRDVTPQNVFVTFDGQVKLLDFGVAKSRAPREATRDGFAKGSLAYMSPDHVGKAAIDRRADVFAVGVILRELLTGERLWGDADDRAIVGRLVAGDVPSFEPRHVTRITPALRRLCETATAVDRADRFTTAHHMAEALDAWLSVEDPHGSLSSELAALFDGELAPARDAVRASLRAARSAPRPPPLPARARTTELGTRDLVPIVEPPPLPVARRKGPFTRRETFTTAMAVIASIAAIVSVAASQLDDEPERVAPHVVAASEPDPSP